MIRVALDMVTRTLAFFRPVRRSEVAQDASGRRAQYWQAFRVFGSRVPFEGRTPLQIIAAADEPQGANGTNAASPSGAHLHECLTMNGLFASIPYERAIVTIAVFLRASSASELR